MLRVRYMVPLYPFISYTKYRAWHKIVSKQIFIELNIEGECTSQMKQLDHKTKPWHHLERSSPKWKCHRGLEACELGTGQERC